MNVTSCLHVQLASPSSLPEELLWLKPGALLGDSVSSSLTVGRSIRSTTCFARQILCLSAEMTKITATTRRVTQLSLKCCFLFPVEICFRQLSNMTHAWWKVTRIATCSDDSVCWVMSRLSVCLRALLPTPPPLIPNPKAVDSPLFWNAADLPSWIFSAPRTALWVTYLTVQQWIPAASLSRSPGLCHLSPAHKKFLLDAVFICAASCCFYLPSSFF